jgi:uncharacterized 2Fe-2S/4Fe-4S cluster protein (DUF4445 family)
MPTLTIMPPGKTVEVAEGTRVLDGILSASVAILHKCDGKAECGSCHIFVQEGRNIQDGRGRTRSSTARRRLLKSRLRLRRAAPRT